MSQLNDALEAFKSHIAVKFPTRIVTRSFKDASLHKREDLLQGVYTLVFQGFPKFDRKVMRWAAPSQAKILLLGQFVVSEDTDPAAVEAQEIVMVGEVIDAVRTAPEPMFIGLGIAEVATSVQQDRPYGWVAALLEMDWVQQF